jgi:hypothetical protein
VSSSPASSRLRKEVLGMLGKLITAVVVIAVVTVVVESLPDIKRYLKMRNMLRTPQVGM